MSELYFRFRRFILLVQTKKVVSMNYSSSTSSWKPRRWVSLDLILMLMDIYINSDLNPLTSSSRSTESNPPIEHLSIDLEDCPNKLENSYKLYNETGHPIVILAESQWKLRQQHDWESYCRTNTSLRRNKSKRTWLWESGIQLRKLTIWVRSFEIEKL